MAYTINKTNGEILLTVLDGTKDTAGGLTFIGKNYVSYGEIQNENFAKLLENFANSVEPADPLKGQLWYDTTSGTNILKVYDGSRFRNVSAQSVSSTAPTVSNLIGDGWWDTTNDQYKVYNGSSWVTVGPDFSKLDGKSGAVPEVMYDGSGNKHVVVSLYHGGSRSLIISYDQTFTPNVAVTGFATISPGVNFNSTVNNNVINGTTKNAQQLGNVAAVSFARKDINETFASDVNVDGILTVGGAVITNNSSTIALVNSNTDGTIKIQSNPGGTTIDSITIDGSTGSVILASHPTAIYGAATKGYIDTTATAITLAQTANLVANVATLNLRIDNSNDRVHAANLLIDSLELRKAPLTSPTFDGYPAVPTQAPGDSSTLVASTEWVQNEISVKAPLNSPALTGTPTAPTPSRGDFSSNIATTAFVRNALPAGVIVMWSGTTSNVPDGWALCDGTNGTPNLLDRFIVAAGNVYTPGTRGGTSTSTFTTATAGAHDHGGGTQGHALTTAEMPVHYHDVDTPIRTYDDSSPHLYDRYGNFVAFDGGYGDVDGDRDSGNPQYYYGSTRNAGSGDAHSHTLTSADTGHTHTVNVDVRPMYYALCFIMKL